jgi:hypothetical protein
MASHWPPERLPIMEVSLSVDDRTLIRGAASFDPGHYNRASTSTRRSNADIDSNHAAKLNPAFQRTYRPFKAGATIKRKQHPVVAMLFRIFEEISSLTGSQGSPIIQDVPPTLSSADGLFVMLTGCSRQKVVTLFERHHQVDAEWLGRSRLVRLRPDDFGMIPEGVSHTA